MNNTNFIAGVFMMVFRGCKKFTTFVNSSLYTGSGPGLTVVIFGPENVLFPQLAIYPVYNKI